MAELKKVKRYDSLDPGRWMTTPFTKTPEGFLTGRAIVTSVGVFSYRNKDGSVTRELRLPKEVFAVDSLNSMKLKPMVNNHPLERVTPENAKNLQIGSLGNNPSDWIDAYGAFSGDENGERGLRGSDGFHVAIDLSITDAVAIKDIEENGKFALSMGYDCEIEETSGVWCGMAYDAIQRNIRYNHGALVDGARAGDAARIRLDGKDEPASDTLFGIHLDGGDAAQINIPSGESRGDQAQDQEVKTMKYRLDNGMEYDAPEGFVQAYVSMKERADSADKSLAKEREDHKTTISKLEAERDTAKDRADKAETEAKKAKEDAAISPDRVKAAAKEMAALYDAADRAGVVVKEDMADMDIKKAVITAVFPKADLKDKDEAYISARYDSAVEMLENRADGESRAVAGEVPSTETRTDSVSARKRMIELNRRLSRGEKAEV
jgi:hypothetical protein